MRTTRIELSADGKQDRAAQTESKTLTFSSYDEPRLELTRASIPPLQKQEQCMQSATNIANTGICRFRASTRSDVFAARQKVCYLSFILGGQHQLSASHGAHTQKKMAFGGK